MRLTALSTLGAASAGVGGFGYARGIEPEWIESTKISLQLPRLPSEFHGYRLVQISDLHADDWMTPQRLSEVVRLVNEQRPDLISITGDFVTSESSIPGPLRDFYADLSKVLGALESKDGTVATLGNHDHWTGAEQIRTVIREGGVTDISNRLRTLRRDGSELHVAGVDDVMEGKDRLDTVLDELPASGAAILLAHEPDFADASAATGRFDLQLSGHSHGGQVRLPLLGPPILPTLARKYPAGSYKIGGMFLHTNRGIGMLAPRVRFNCRPEITIFTLQSESNSASS